MASRQTGYQYETSPRKIEPDYEVRKKSTKIQNNRTKPAQKAKRKYNTKPILYIVVGFAMLFTICYRNSLINESYNKKESLKTQLTEVQKENEQMKVNIEASSNLNAVEKRAESELGMQKLSNNQKIYVNLQKKDYVEPATEKVSIDDESSWWNKILKSLTQVIK